LILVKLAKSRELALAKRQEFELLIELGWDLSPLRLVRWLGLV
jgi:hypothetical protein